MRKAALLIAILIAFAVTLPAQSKKPRKPATKKRPAATKFVRVPFDPKRDAKADLDAAITKATAEKKRIILDIGGEWCGWCVYMDKFFAKHPSLAKLRDDNFVWVKVNFSEENENTAFLSAYPPIDGYPHFLVLEADGRLVHSQETSRFERGDFYSATRLKQFLNDWKPPVQ